MTTFYSEAQWLIRVSLDGAQQEDLSQDTLPPDIPQFHDNMTIEVVKDRVFVLSVVTYDASDATRPEGVLLQHDPVNEYQRHSQSPRFDLRGDPPWWLLSADQPFPRARWSAGPSPL